jgi:hypothetical protein
MRQNFMKNCILFFVFLILAAVITPAQEASLRRGYYRTQVSADEILILPGTAFDLKAEGFRQRYGYYGMSLWSGSVRYGKMMFVATGIISGNEICFIVDEAEADTIYEATRGLITIPVGTLIIYTIVKHESFLDNTGQSWVWHRDNRGF